MRASLEATQATNLVGKVVIMGIETNGETNFISGRVDQVRREGSKTYLSIEGSWYNIDDLDTVVDEDYMEATLIGEDFKKEIDKMPDPKKLTLAHQKTLAAITAAYNSLTAYQQNYIKSYYKDEYAKFEALVERMKELSPPEEDDTTDCGDKTEGSGDGEGSSDGTTEGTEGAA